MKKSWLIAAVVLSLFVVTSVSGQPTPEPKTKVPAAKVDTKAEPVVKNEIKVEGKVEVPKAGEVKVEAKKDEDQVKWWEVLLQHLMELAFTILGLMTTALVTVLLKKYGFEAHNAKINDVLMKAINFAEQKATKAAKLEEGTKTSGAEKMVMAVDFATSLAKEYKLSDKGRDWWEEKLESWLGVTNS